MRHAIGGLSFIQDFRRNTGYADMMEYSRRKYSTIPRILWERFKREFSDCRRLGPNYLKWYDWPLMMFLLIIVRFFEIPGMFDAIKGKKHIPNSAFR